MNRVRPYHLVIGFGVFWALFSIGSGVAPLVFQWFDDSPVQREVFENIPSAWKLGFYTLLPVVFVYGAVMFANRVKNWERGAPDARETNLKTAPKRFADFRAGVYMQTLLRDPAAGLMHSLIYFSFLILFAVTAVSQIQDQVPEGWKFLHGRTYQAYSFVGDAAGLVFVIGIGWALAAALRPAALPHPHQVQARAPADPRRVLRARRHRLPRRSVPHRVPRPARLREVELHRLPDVVAVPEHRASARLAAVDVAGARARLLRVPRHPADDDDPAHVHVAVEHVQPRA